jgi:hypothetical protein
MDPRRAIGEGSQERFYSEEERGLGEESSLCDNFHSAPHIFTNPSKDDKDEAVCGTYFFPLQRSYICEYEDSDGLGNHDPVSPLTSHCTPRNEDKFGASYTRACNPIMFPFSNCHENTSSITVGGEPDRSDFLHNAQLQIHSTASYMNEKTTKPAKSTSHQGFTAFSTIPAFSKILEDDGYHDAHEFSRHAILVRNMEHIHWANQDCEESVYTKGTESTTCPLSVDAVQSSSLCHSSKYESADILQSVSLSQSIIISDNDFTLGRKYQQLADGQIFTSLEPVLIPISPSGLSNQTFDPNSTLVIPRVDQQDGAGWRLDSTSWRTARKSLETPRYPIQLSSERRFVGISPNLEEVLTHEAIQQRSKPPEVPFFQDSTNFDEYGIAYGPDNPPCQSFQQSFDKTGRYEREVSQKFAFCPLLAENVPERSCDESGLFSQTNKKYRSQLLPLDFLPNRNIVSQMEDNSMRCGDFSEKNDPQRHLRPRTPRLQLGFVNHAICMTDAPRSRLVVPLTDARRGSQASCTVNEYLQSPGESYLGFC